MFRLLLIAAVVAGALFGIQKLREADVDSTDVVPAPTEVQVNVPNPMP